MPSKKDNLTIRELIDSLRGDFRNYHVRGYRPDDIKVSVDLIDHGPPGAEWFRYKGPYDAHETFVPYSAIAAIKPEPPKPSNASP